MRGIFLTGTDTGVGKTATGTALVAAARARGWDWGAAKPVESGCEGGPPADASAYAALTGDPLAQVCPFRLDAPLAPGIAALREGRSFTLEDCVAAVTQVAARHDVVVVEGAGGLLVPLTPAGDTVADLIAALKLPVVLVAADRLGTLNHAALSAHLLTARGLPCLGIVLNATANPDPSTESNAAWLPRLTGLPLLARLPWADVGARAAALATAVSFWDRIGDAFTCPEEGSVFL